MEVEFIEPGNYEWIVPPAVTKVRVVCIGGGSSNTYGSGSTGSGSTGWGGIGGGMVTADITVYPGQVIPLTVGSTGSLTTYVSSQTQLPAGSASKFGEYISAHGGNDKQKNTSKDVLYLINNYDSLANICFMDPRDAANNMDVRKKNLPIFNNSANFFQSSGSASSSGSNNIEYQKMEIGEAPMSVQSLSVSGEVHMNYAPGLFDTYPSGRELGSRFVYSPKFYQYVPKSLNINSSTTALSWGTESIPGQWGYIGGDALNNAGNGCPGVIKGGNGGSNGAGGNCGIVLGYLNLRSIGGTGGNGGASNSIYPHGGNGKFGSWGGRAGAYTVSASGSRNTYGGPAGAGGIWIYY